jgi:hypothetical protein
MLWEFCINFDMLVTLRLQSINLYLFIKDYAFDEGREGKVRVLFMIS